MLHCVVILWITFIDYISFLDTFLKWKRLYFDLNIPEVCSDWWFLSLDNSILDIQYGELHIIGQEFEGDGGQLSLVSYHHCLCWVTIPWSSIYNHMCHTTPVLSSCYSPTISCAWLFKHELQFHNPIFPCSSATPPPLKCVVLSSLKNWPMIMSYAVLLVSALVGLLVSYYPLFCYHFTSRW